MRTALLIPFVLLATPALGEPHRIPDAPADYLARSNPFDPAKVDDAFVEKTGRVFRAKCQKCHGERGDGQGPNAEFLVIKPAAFAAPGYLKGRKDGQLFWIIENGSPGTDMPAHGPGTTANFSEEEIWRLITFLRRQFTH